MKKAISFKLVGYIPLFYLLSYFTFIIRARIKIGYYPYYDHPDPKNLNFNLHLGLIWILLFLSILSFPYVYVIIYRIYRFKENTKCDIVNSIIYVISFALIIYNFIYDPFGFNEWFID